MQIAGYAVGTLIVLYMITKGRQSSIKVWRDPAHADWLTRVRRVRPFTSYAGSRGVTRGALPMSVSVGLLGAAIVAGSALPTGVAHHFGPALIITIVFFALMLICWGLVLSIIWFNRPRVLVPPYMRGEDGMVTGWWRCRDLPSDQRRAARLIRRNGQRLGYPPPPAADNPLTPVPGGSVIVLSRVDGVRKDRRTEYEVAIDGKRVALIRPGDRLEMPVPAGRHAIFLQAQWARSPRFDVDAAPGEVVGLQCAPGTVSPYSPGGADNYIKLTRDDQTKSAKGTI